MEAGCKVANLGLEITIGPRCFLSRACPPGIRAPVPSLPSLPVCAGQLIYLACVCSQLCGARARAVCGRRHR